MTTSYSYDVNDRLIKVLTSGAGAQTRTFSYDLRGFLRSETHPEKGPVGNGSVDYSRYDALGNARKKVDGSHDLRYTFDRANRLTQVHELPSGASAVRKLQEWTYGTVNEGGNRKLGKVIEQTRWNFIQLSTVPPTPYTGRIKEFFTYAGRDGRISSSRLEGRAFVTGTIPEPEGPTEKFESSWIYDPLGNVTSIDYPRCVDNNPEPDSCPNPSEVARVVTPTYEQGLLKTVMGYASGITYHPNLLVNEITHTNGIKVTQGNDPKSMHRPSVITAAKGLQTLWTTGQFTYDGAGNLKTIGSWAFEYDKVSRLTKAAFNLAPVGAAVSPKTQSFTYDAFGNLQEIVGDAGRVTTTNSGTNRLATAGSQYDASGNLTNWSTNALYGWDALDKMWRMKNGSEEWYYFYNADGERVWSYRFGGTHSRWTPRDPGGMVLREFEVLNGTWQISNDYIYRGSQLLASETLSGTRHFHSDHLGTPRLITDSVGNQVAYHVYYPYGEEATAFNQDGQRMKFTGHERDLASAAGQGDDLDYMHARFCSPITGRFLSVDTYAGNNKTPQSLNRYAYTMGNPLIFLDPNGKQSLNAVGISLAVAGAELIAGFGDFLEGGVRAGQDRSGLTLQREGLENRTTDFQNGYAMGDFLATHDTVVEGSLSFDVGGASVVVGAAMVNQNDPYLFGGVGTSASLSPVSASFSFGTVQNYQGTGTYGGQFIGATIGAPVGVGVAGNPSQPNGAVSTTVVFSSDLGLFSQNYTYYLPLANPAESPTSSRSAPPQ